MLEPRTEEESDEELLFFYLRCFLLRLLGADGLWLCEDICGLMVHGLSQPRLLPPE